MYNENVKKLEILRSEITYLMNLHMGMTVVILSSDLSTKEGKDQESIQSSTTPDPGYEWESDNFTIRHHKREPKGQPFPNR